ncbi:MAG: tRNA (adenosine(37)-N6)-threonylcarbamoyltransferase complex dimerization subunit type 1 TsaB [Mariprofundaceae bacterium]
MFPPSPLNILALDTACGLVAACLRLGDDMHLVREDAGQPRSVNLAATLAKLLQKADAQWPDLDAFAFGCGPGSFTGLRIGAATLAGLNSGLGRPILHISSLAITAAQAGSDAVVSVIEDARAGEAFCAAYQTGHAIEPDRCLSWQEVAALPSGAFVSQGDPAIALPDWQRLPLTLSRSQALARVLDSTITPDTDWQAMPRYPQPAYLQASQAEKNAHV